MAEATGHGGDNVIAIGYDLFFFWVSLSYFVGLLGFDGHIMWLEMYFACQ